MGEGSIQFYRFVGILSALQIRLRGGEAAWGRALCKGRKRLNVPGVLSTAFLFTPRLFSTHFAKFSVPEAGRVSRLISCSVQSPVRPCWAQVLGQGCLTHPWLHPAISRLYCWCKRVFAPSQQSWNKKKAAGAVPALPKGERITLCDGGAETTPGDKKAALP